MSDATRLWSLERLAAGLWLAVVAFAAATRLMASWPDPMVFGYFQFASAGLGFLIGWRTIGTKLGYGMGPGLAAGITGAVLLAFWGFVVFSLYVWIARNLSMGSSTGGIAPDVAMRAYWTLVKTWGQNLTDIPFWAILLGGGAVVGLLAELISPRRP